MIRLYYPENNEPVLGNPEFSSLCNLHNWIAQQGPFWEKIEAQAPDLAAYLHKFRGTIVVARGSEEPENGRKEGN